MRSAFRRRETWSPRRASAAPSRSGLRLAPVLCTPCRPPRPGASRFSPTTTGWRRRTCASARRCGTPEAVDWFESSPGRRGRFPLLRFFPRPARSSPPPPGMPSGSGMPSAATSCEALLVQAKGRALLRCRRMASCSPRRTGTRSRCGTWPAAKSFTLWLGQVTPRPKRLLSSPSRSLHSKTVSPQGRTMAPFSFGNSRWTGRWRPSAGPMAIRIPSPSPLTGRPWPPPAPCRIPRRCCGTPGAGARREACPGPRVRSWRSRSPRMGRRSLPAARMASSRCGTPRAASRCMLSPQTPTLSTPSPFRRTAAAYFQLAMICRRPFGTSRPARRGGCSKAVRVA